MALSSDRRAYRRNAVQMPLELSDLSGAVIGHTIDVSRGGLLATTSIPVVGGTLLRVRVLTAETHSALAIGVVVRSSDGVAIALTSTSEAWDRFWEDLNAIDRVGGEA